jgi:hypothetical protein
MTQGYIHNTYGGAALRRRKYHMLGVFIAITLLAVGVAVIAAALVRLDLMEELQNDTLAIVLTIVLGGLGAVCLPVYALVRLAGWVINLR